MKKIVLNTSFNSKGFTLIELVVVIIVVSVLAVVALPRFMHSYDAAHDSTVTATGGALASAVILVRSQWVGNGSSSTTDGVRGYGDNDVATTSKGWPSDAQAARASKHGANISGDTARCIRMWRSLLVASAPTVSANNDGSSDYWVALPKGTVCRYTYVLNDKSSRIEYNLQSGSVITLL